MPIFKKDQIVYRKDIRYKILRSTAEDETLLENDSTGQIDTHKTFNLLTEYMTGDLCLHSERKQKTPSIGETQDSSLRMEHLTDRDRDGTRRRIDFIVQLTALGSFEKSKGQLIADIAVLSIKRGEKYPPDVSTIYRWRALYLKENQSVRALMALTSQRGGKGKHRLDPAVEAMLEEKIDDIYLGSRVSTAEDVHGAMGLAIDEANKQRPPSLRYVAPGLRTIQRRIANLPAYDVAVARFGEREAERRLAAISGSRPMRRILDLVEVDHTPVDLLVVNDLGVVIGRPTFTVVLDRKSRCVLGFCLSLAGYGTPTVFEAFRHALLPKTYLAGKGYVDLGLRWPCHGWPTIILMDNGSEFHSHAVVDALTNIDIIAEFAASRSPNDKPHVERFLKTFNYSFIHKQPGTTLAKIHKRIGFKSEDEACHTLESLNRAIHIWICQVYHLRKHRGLGGRTPLAVWEEQAREMPTKLKFNAAEVAIAFSEIDERVLQQYGIEINNCIYSSTRLNQVFRALPANSKVIVKWPRNDVGHIWVWDPLSEEYVKATNNDPEAVGLTLDQHTLVRKMRASGDPDYSQTKASGEAIIRSETDKMAADQKLKKRKLAARTLNKTSKPSNSESPAIPVTSSMPPAAPQLYGSKEAVAFDVVEAQVEEMSHA